jgi:hypothetical protein
VDIKVYKFEDYSVEVVQELAHNLPQSLQDELIGECTDLSRDSFGNPDIKEEFVRFCILNSSSAVFIRDYTTRLIGYTSHSIKKIEEFYIIYFQSIAILKKYQGLGLFKVLISVKMIERKNKIIKEGINSDYILIACRTQNPLAFKFVMQNLDLFPKPDGTIDKFIRNIGKKFAESLYDKHHVEVRVQRGVFIV